MNSLRISLFLILVCCYAAPLYARPEGQRGKGHIHGTIKSSDQQAVFATVFLKDTNIGVATAQDGNFKLTAPTGDYVLVVYCLGYRTEERNVTIEPDRSARIDVTISPAAFEVDEIVISASGVSRINRSAYNAVAIDTRTLQNASLNLGDALGRAPGLKFRESGGVGSDAQLMLDGFSGRHVKVFIDGVPQEGAGGSFGLNNLPVNYAERIEVYKGVVPVDFGTDAIGGIINIVTKKETQARNRWFLDASYSYGSFNTHKSYVNFGQTFKNGFTYEINAFQNYSDNSYHIDTKVKQFLEGGYTKTTNELYRVKRFHDTYHDEAVVGKVGVVGKKWADRLMFGLSYSQMYKEIQNGVRQEIVFGGKYRKGHSLMPSLEYSKQNLFTKGLDVKLTANYNRNQIDNVDTCRYEFNWLGDMRERTTPGEQNYQHTRQHNDNWSGTFNINYRLGTTHTFTLNHQIGSFRRKNESMLTGGSTSSIPSENLKNVSGLSYRLRPSDRWNLSLFGKYYYQRAVGSVAQTQAQDTWLRVSRSIDYIGYGAAATCFIMSELQAKLSYEKAARMPTDSEMFGDGDLETGNFEIKPENSHNINLSLSYDKTFGRHSVYAEGALIYRDTRDYIMRTITGSGGKLQGEHINHGKVLTKGFNIGLRYSFSNWLSVGGSFTHTDARNNVKTTANGQPDATYGVRMPNTPYQFANIDLTLSWHGLGRRGNVLSFTYDNLYMHSFPLNFENLGSREDKMYVPEQFSHNISISYSINNGRYNFSVECRNLFDADLYDNFSLQKAGRAVYAKLRVYFGN